MGSQDELKLFGESFRTFFGELVSKYEYATNFTAVTRRGVFLFGSDHDLLIQRSRS